MMQGKECIRFKSEVFVSYQDARQYMYDVAARHYSDWALVPAVTRFIMCRWFIATDQQINSVMNQVQRAYYQAKHDQLTISTAF
jgi:hypothetical protein